MMTIAQATDVSTVLLKVRSQSLQVSSEEFDRLCEDNPDLRLEMTHEGKLIVMSPTFGDSGKRNTSLLGQVWAWNEASDLGEVFDSSTGYDFTAIGGGRVSPDVSWIEHSRLVGVSLKQFIPVVPDFVIELRSNSDRLSDLQEKMREYQRLGVRLGLLIDPQNKKVEIYLLSGQVETLDAPMTVDCDAVMPRFRLHLQKMW
jgi:Uma2 family endonuclease